MHKDDIIRMAREAGLCSTLCGFDDWIDAGPSKPEIVAFARLVAAAEREACAKVCDGFRYTGYVPPEDGAAARYYDDAANECAATIRARGQQ